MTEYALPQRYSTGRLLRLSGPLTASLFLEQLIGITDVVFLGRVGTIELGAAAIAAVAFMMLAMLGGAYGFGMQSYIGQLNGEKDFKGVGQTFQNGTVFLAALSVLVIGLSWTLAPAFLAWACHSPEIKTAAQDYLFWRVLGLPFIYFCAAFRAFFIAVLRPRVLTLGSLMLVAANFVFSYVFIFGAGPVPAMGMAGAGIGATLANLVTCLFFAWYTVTKTDHRRYHLFGAFKHDWSLQMVLFRLGRWLMLQNGIAFAAWLLFFVAIEHLGATALAISNIVRQICSLLFIFMNAVGATVGAIAANMIGQQRFDDVPAVARRGLGLCAVVMVPIMGLMAALPVQTMSIFSNLTEVVNAAVPTLRVLLACYLIGIPATYISFMMDGIGQTKVTSVATVSASVIFIAAVQSLMLVSDNVAVIWASYAVYYAVTAGIILLAFKRGYWRHRLRTAQPVQAVPA